MENKKNVGGRPRKLLPHQEQEVYKMYLECNPIYEIVSKFKVSERTINRIVKKHKTICDDCEHKECFDCPELNPIQD